MIDVYTIRFNYNDEFCNGDEPHDCLILVYKTGTADGDNLQHALELANEDGDYSEVDRLLLNLCGLKDEDICFYFDFSKDLMEIDDGVNRLVRLVPELQNSFDIIINNIWKERRYSNG